MCTVYPNKVNIPYIMGYKVFRKLDNGDLVSFFGLSTKPYKVGKVNVCDSEEGFHVLLDMRTAISLAEDAKQHSVIHRVLAMNVHTIGVWGMTGSVQCKKIEIHSEITV